MVLCSVKCVDQVSKYLGVSSKKLHISTNNIVASDDLIPKRTVEGFSTIIQALARNSQCPNILGHDQITQALTRQWLEYAILHVNYVDNPTNAKRILKELNTALKGHTYITGTSKTVADIALYYILHSIMNELTYQEKVEFINISRWFDNLQQDEKLRQKLNVINFDLMCLYI